MVLCIIAFFVFAVLSIFSAKYRPIAKEAFACVFKTITLKPCDTGMDDRFKAEVVSALLKISPHAAKFTNKNFVLLSWIFVLLSFASMIYTIYGIYNFYFFGNCEGLNSNNICILNDITGDYGRFSEPKDLIFIDERSGISLGNPNSTNLIIEYGCFTCPYTAKAEDTILEVVEKNDVYYVFKPFPLPNHEYSYETAKAVLCARDQGKAFEMRKAVFSQMEACGESGVIAIKVLANQSGLEMEEFQKCFDGNNTVKELEGYIDQGKSAHIYATPTFFVNGEPVVGPKSAQEIERLLK